MAAAALAAEAFAKVGCMANDAMVNEISKNKESAMLPRFKVDVKREFHDTEMFEDLRVDLSPTPREPFIFSPRFIAEMYGAVAMKDSCHLASICQVT